MGTRALITIDEKPFIATHWDGYPSALGAALLKTASEAEIIQVAQEHTIEFAVPQVQTICDQKRYEEIAQNTEGKYTAKQIAELDAYGFIGVRGDSLISPIENYGDWAEYQYDWSDGKWRYRELSGAYPNSSAGPLKPLRKQDCKD